VAAGYLEFQQVEVEVDVDAVQDEVDGRQHFRVGELLQDRCERVVRLDRSCDFSGSPVIGGTDEEIEVSERSFALRVVPAGCGGWALEGGELDTERSHAGGDL